MYKGIFTFPKCSITCWKWNSSWSIAVTSIGSTNTSWSVRFFPVPRTKQRACILTRQSGCQIWHTAILCVTDGKMFAPSINTISKMDTVTYTQIVICVCYFVLALLRDILKVTCCMKGSAITHVSHFWASGYILLDPWWMN